MPNCVDGGPTSWAGTFDSVPEAVYATGLDRRIVYANPACEALFGHAVDDMVGQRASMLFATSGAAGCLHPAGGQVSPEGRVERGEHRRRDGTSFLGSCTVSSWRDEAGQHAGTLCIVRVASRMERSLHAMETLSRIGADTRLAHDAKIRAVLALGAAHFELPLAIVSRVDGADYHVEHVSDPSGAVKAGDTFPLSTTYCVHTLEAGGPTGFHLAGQSSIRDHPCYEARGLEAYLGGPIRVDGEVYGTLNFSRSEPCAPFTSDDMALVSLCAQWVGHLVAEQRSREALQRLANVDALTGLLNRRAVLGQLTWQLAHARRSKLPLSVVMLDVDRFKSINDSWGHAAGDDVLRGLGRVCRGMVREVDVCGRLGGEEFLLVLPDTDLAGASRMCRRLLRALRWNEVEVDTGDVLTVTASVGVASAREGETIEELLARADDAMFAAKAGGRDQMRLAG